MTTAGCELTSRLFKPSVRKHSKAAVTRNEHTITGIDIYAKGKVDCGKQELWSDLKVLRHKRAIVEQLPDFCYTGRELLQYLPVRMKRNYFFSQLLG